VAQYWIDLNVLVEAKDRYYGFDIARGFWDFLDQHSATSTIQSPMRVYYEIMKYGDDALSTWARERSETRLFVEPSDDVQEAVTDIADFVNGRYTGAEASNFLDGADPWLIAHAKCDQSSVVTLETLVGPNSRKAKIPNVCQEFGVQWLDTFTMLRELRASFVLRRSQ